MRGVLPVLSAALCLILCPLPGWAQDGLAMLEDVTPADLEATLVRSQIRPPVNPVTLSVLEKLPERLFVYHSSEPSMRLETNPYQSPRGAIFQPFRDRTDAFRMQSDTTIGYSLTPTTRVSANYFLLSDHFNDFTPFHLDSTVQSVSLSLEQDVFQKGPWLGRTTCQARQLFLGNGSRTGDVVPSALLMRRLGDNGYGYVNGALTMSRNDFVLGDLDRITPIFTLGLGYTVPYDLKSRWARPLGGLALNMSNTYSFNTNLEEVVGTPRNYQSMILTTEVSKPLKKNVPVSLFVRAEPVFYFGHQRKALGVSGVNFRLFGGVRMSMNKPAIFTMSLDPPKPRKLARKPASPTGKPDVKQAGQPATSPVSAVLSPSGDKI